MRRKLFNLYSFTANSDDGLQIVEQILPFFQPDFTVTINAIPDLNIKRDIPIILDSVAQEDAYEGDLTTRQVLTYTLEFTMKNYIYGPVTSSEIIRTVKARTYIEPGTGPVSSQDTDGKVLEQVITPNPSGADPDESFTYNEDIDFFEIPTVTYSDDKSSDPK